MKKYIAILALLFASTLQAQKTDSVKNAIHVTPIVYSAMMKDTLNQLTISVFNLNVNDTASGCSSYIQFYNRKEKQIGAMNVPIPAATVNLWGVNDKIIEDYILNFLNLKRK